ncbi:LysE family translocator [Polaromonas sp.]|uniref:LysE family translocator n=1 Tax=Polaromonas sp. TaxID=1869339 RepID=UPI00356135B2
MATEQLLLFIAAGVLLNLTPGPDVLYIVTHALRRGARAGVVAALGITAGCFVHIVAAALGVSALLAASGTAFAVLKWAGAAYLVYVGVRLLTARNTGFAIDSGADDVGPPRAGALKSIFSQGFWTNVLNPKVALFFLAFVPQFIAPDVVNKPLAFLLLGLLFNFNGLWVNIGWALTAAWLAQRAAALQQGMAWLDRVAGAVFITFGLKLALTDNPSD